MKTKDFRDLKTKSIEELKKLAANKRLEAIKAKNEVAAGKEKNLKLSMNIRREVAKILTLIKEKEIVELVEAKKEKKQDKQSLKSSNE